ncbi:MAG: VOC family protein [Planctomycetes bacterium]|nr:VOC family protein [Planctomycetota bacterium]
MPNPLCHFEFMTSDPEKCKAFYGALFDWRFDDRSMPGYTLVQPGAEPTGGIFPRPPSAPAGCVNVYFHVDDLAATLRKATELGGTILVDRTPIPKVGHFAMITDPEGITIGLMQPSH